MKEEAKWEYPDPEQIKEQKKQTVYSFGEYFEYDESEIKSEIKQEGIKYPCNQCDYKATQQSHLQQHIKSKHEGIKYPCILCDYQATQKGDLQRHIQSKHEQYRDQ